MATDDVDPHGSGGDISRCPIMSGYNPLSEAEILDPYPSYERSRHERPVFFDDTLGFWSVSRRDDVLAIMRDTQRFSNRSAIPMPLPPERMRQRMPKYPFATACAACSSFQRYSLCPAVVALGMKTISAPASPSARAPSGKWRS